MRNWTRCSRARCLVSDSLCVTVNKSTIGMKRTFKQNTLLLPRRYNQKNPPTELKNQTTHHVQTSSACTLVASFFTDSVSFGCSNKSKHCQKTCIVQHSGRRCGIEVLEYIMLWMHNRTGSNCNSCHFYPIC
jgi:hypothetical protein